VSGYLVAIRIEAEAELAKAFEWYEERRAGLGYEFCDEVRSTLKSILDSPLHHAVLYRNVRRALVRRFPYKISTT
jgi:hypothetical protein